MNEWVIKIKIYIKLECLRRIQNGLRKRSCGLWSGGMALDTPVLLVRQQQGEQTAAGLDVVF